MARSIDLTGQHFGNLTVIEKTQETQNKHRLWRCRCTCGSEILVNTERLKRGTVTNCGCIPRATARRGSVREDLTGKRFGRLQVLYPAENHRGRTSWVCRCDCGNLHIATSHDLKAGKTTSCGCLKTEIQQNVKNQLHRIDGTCVEWLEKRKHRSDNTSGFRGVCLCRGKFRATIGFKKQRFHIGTYDTFEEAVQARLDAEKLIHEGFVKAYYTWQKQGGDEPFVYEVEKVDGWFRIHTNV